MTISTTISRAEYAGNGVTTVFAFPYLFFENGDLLVYLVSATGVVTLQTITTDYTVSGAGTGAGGAVTMLAAPASGERLVIVREVALTQETDYISGDPFPAESHERALDRLTMQVQQLQEQLDRTVGLSVTDGGLVSTSLPPAEAGKLIGWDGAEEGLTNYTPSTSELAVPQTSTVGSAILPSGTTAQRDDPPADGYFRHNSTLGRFEGYTNGGWGSVGGATGGGSDAVFYLNGKTVTQSFSIPADQNAMSAGPITIADGATVTIPDGSSWTIVG